MKTVKTKIPNNEIKGNYALMHVESFDNILQLLENLNSDFCNDNQCVLDFIGDIKAELDYIKSQRGILGSRRLSKLVSIGRSQIENIWNGSHKYD